MGQPAETGPASGTNWALSLLAVLSVGPLLLMAFGAFATLASGLFFTFMAFALAQAAFSFEGLQPKGYLGGGCDAPRAT